MFAHARIWHVIPVLATLGYPCLLASGKLWFNWLKSCRDYANSFHKYHRCRWKLPSGHWLMFRENMKSGLSRIICAGCVNGRSLADLQQFFTGKLYVLVQQLKLPAEELLWLALPCAGDLSVCLSYSVKPSESHTVTCVACSCVEKKAMTPAVSCNKKPIQHWTCGSSCSFLIHFGSSCSFWIRFDVFLCLDYSRLPCNVFMLSTLSARFA